jgi:lysozyme
MTPMPLEPERKPTIRDRIAANPRKATGAAMAAAIALSTPLIMRWEGTRLDPYLDLARIPTVCTGHTGPDVIMGHRLTPAQCRTILEADILKHSAPVLKCVPELDDRPYQLAASISLAFNIGTGAYCGSTAARLFKAGDWRGGCNAFLRWNKVKGRTIQGLSNRRADERRLCLTDIGGL